MTRPIQIKSEVLQNHAQEGGDLPNVNADTGLIGERDTGTGAWRTGSVAEFLGMSSEEALLMEIRVCLTRTLRQARKRNQLTQAEVAERANTGQPRIARLEAGDPRATLDLMLRASLAAGALPSEIATAFSDAAAYAEKFTGKVNQTK